MLDHPTQPRPGLPPLDDAERVERARAVRDLLRRTCRYFSDAPVRAR